MNVDKNNSETNTVIFIGGASASGKTTVCKILSERLKLPVVNLDAYYMLLEQTKNIDKDIEIDGIMITLASYIIEDLLKSGGNCIVEGVWINPEMGKKISSRCGNKFKQIYCGYPNTDPEERLNSIKKTGKHFLVKKPHKYAIDYIGESIKKSQELEEQCKLLGLPYIDFSDQAQGSKNLLELFQLNVDYNFQGASRNALCQCGSGKRYKHCHGAI